jgi:hypothetical protein
MRLSFGRFEAVFLETGIVLENFLLAVLLSLEQQALIPHFFGLLAHAARTQLLGLGSRSQKGRLSWRVVHSSYQAEL